MEEQCNDPATGFRGGWKSGRRRSMHDQNVRQDVVAPGSGQFTGLRSTSQRLVTPPCLPCPCSAKAPGRWHRSSHHKAKPRRPVPSGIPARHASFLLREWLLSQWDNEPVSDMLRPKGVLRERFRGEPLFDFAFLPLRCPVLLTTCYASLRLFPH